jgi:LysM repeat protein
MNQELSQAFHDILEGLESGQSLEELLASYPDLADELRPLLHTAASIPNARVHRSEIQAMRSRLDSQFEDQLAALNFPKKRSIRPLLTLVASLALIVLGIWIFLPRGDSQAVTEITLTQSTQVLSETAIATTFSPSASPTTALPSATTMPSATQTRIAVTVSPSPSPSPTKTQSASSPSPSSNPSTEEACIPRSNWPQYRIQSGDTLSQIAINSGTSLETLILANCLTNPRSLMVGQIIVVPRLWANADSTEQNDDNSGSDSGDDNSGSGSDDDNSGSDSEDDSEDDNSGSSSDDDGEDNSGSGSNNDSEDDNSGSGSDDD